MFLSDLRDLERKAIPEMHLAMQLFSNFAPNLAKRRDNLKGPPFEEAVLPAKLQHYTADLRCSGGFLRPNQLMANYVSKDLANVRIQIPSYTPYIGPFFLWI